MEKQFKDSLANNYAQTVGFELINNCTFKMPTFTFTMYKVASPMYPKMLTGDISLVSFTAVIWYVFLHVQLLQEELLHKGPAFVWSQVFPLLNYRDRYLDWVLPSNTGWSGWRKA